jgi:hypothetical protein
MKPSIRIEGFISQWRVSRSVAGCIRRPGEGGTRSPPFNRSRTLGGGERTLAIKTPVISRGLRPRRQHDHPYDHTQQ